VIPRPLHAGCQPADAHPLLTGAARGVLVAASKDPDSKATFVITDPAGAPEGQVAVKIPATPAAGATVEREGRMLVELRRMPLGRIAHTVPRYVGSRSLGGLPVLVSTAMPGTPMAVCYHQWLHTARPEPVRRDFRAAGEWLAALQTVTSRRHAPVTWPEDVATDLAHRWDGHPQLTPALDRLSAAAVGLSGHRLPLCTVHGDFWFGNVLVEAGEVSGVIDWEAAETTGSPLRDLVRFALSYSLYLDRHTRAGHRVPGHRSLRRTGFAPGVRYALLGEGWYPTLVRSFLRDGLARLRLPTGRWYAAALTGVAEIAASANDPDFAAGHLELIASLPNHPRRPRGRRDR
jgi:hypothetical protein